MFNETETIENLEELNAKSKELQVEEFDHEDEIFRNLEKRILKNSFKILLASILITAIYTRLNYLYTNSLSESNSVIQKFYQNFFTSNINIDFPQHFLPHLISLTNNPEISSFEELIDKKENYTKDYVLHAISSLKLKLYQFKKLKNKAKLPFDHLFAPILTNDEQDSAESVYEPREEFINESVCFSIFYKQYNPGFRRTHGVFKNVYAYLTGINCVDSIDEYDSNCDGYQLFLNKSTEPDLDLIKCITDQFDIKSIKYEVNLFNHNLKQFVYINFYVLYFPSGGFLHKIQVDIIDFDRSLCIFGRVTQSFFKKALCLFVIILIYLIYLVLFIRRLIIYKMALFIKFTYLTDFCIMMVLTRLFYIEFRIYFEAGHNLKNYFSEPYKYYSFYEVSWFYRRFDLLVGIIYAFCCFEITIYSRFNEMISNIVMTFQKSYLDLIGFFIIFFGLILSYAIELQFLYGGNFSGFSTFLKCFSTLFRFMWGEIDIFALLEHDRKSFYFFASYLLVMIIIMFNLMLAIILGTYDMVRKDPTCRDSSMKLDKFIFLFTERFIKKNFPKFSIHLHQILNFRSINRLYCVQDIERKFTENGFEEEKVAEVLKEFKLRSEHQIDNFKVETLIKRMFEIEYDHKPKLRINDEELADEYVTNDEWTHLLIKYNNLENYCTLIEKRLDVMKNFMNIKSNN
ncbi:polycystic kidney disease 2-like 1 [Brachionus plicatilis]|uniref:Polycystic kidney disease 2-like 1 n=1 Tax=Brachionus plicatilis TaxID=10195 RepID=A0A3M7RT57_BRAPC|nr:polycystic kidney disease 2-like 1 [Brachionus plicatilis]